MNSASHEYRKMSAKREAQFVPIGLPTVCWKTFPDMVIYAFYVCVCIFQANISFQLYEKIILKVFLDESLK